MISDNQCLHVVSDERKACFFFFPLHFSQSVYVKTHSLALIFTIARTDVFVPLQIQAAFSD